MAAAPLLSASGLHKRFGGVHALRGADLTVQGHEIHALVGANGSGKSTLLGILSGQVVPDDGTVTIAAETLAFGRPRVSAAAGIAIVTQETTLVPQLTVAENIMLGPVKPRRGRAIDWAGVRRAAAAALARLGVELDVGRKVSTLRPDECQLVEIARAVSRSARILILDEATSSLTDEEVEGLFGVMRSLRDDGVGVISVSHRMSEVFAVADAVTVLRGGQTVAAGPVGDFEVGSLVEAMTGRKHQEHVPHPHRAGSTPRLRVRGLSAHRVLHDVDIDVGKQEIVGLAGLIGSGRSELLEVLFGVRRRLAGEVELDGKTYAPRAPREAIAAGAGLVGADRKASGLVMSMSLEENISMVGTRGVARWKLAGRGSERAAAKELAGAMGIVAPSLEVPAGSLSGGNQQKVVLAKWMQMNPRLLLLDEPTRGVDVVAKSDIYTLLRTARDRDVSVLLSSSEIPELLAVCDRIVVMARGRVQASVDAESASEGEILALASSPNQTQETTPG
jgi:ABC-type sugar transport system ATPase subunit